MSSDMMPKRWSNQIGYFNLYSQVYKLHQNQKLPPVVLLQAFNVEDIVIFVSWLVGLIVCDNQNACTLCQGCKDFLDGNHSDVLWIFAQGNSIKVDNILELQEHLKVQASKVWYTAAQKRVVVLHNADKLNIASANRLLKTLEEPPLNSMIILTAQYLHPILPTIKSRCVIWKLKNFNRTHSIDIDVNSLEIAKKLVNTFFNTHDFNEIFKFIKEQKIDLPVILNAIELVINEQYKQTVLVTEQDSYGYASSYYQLVRRREILSKLRKFVIKDKIPINSSFALESLLLV